MRGADGGLAVAGGARRHAQRLAEAARTSHTRRRDGQDARRRSVSHALRGFGEVMGAASPNGPADPLARTPLQEAATLVAESCDASLKAGSAWSDVRGPVRAIEALARRSGIRTRWIALAPGWWRRDGPSLVGFATAKDGKDYPVAILSDGRGTYRTVDPKTGKRYRVTRRKWPRPSRPPPERLIGRRGRLPAPDISRPAARPSGPGRAGTGRRRRRAGGGNVNVAREVRSPVGAGGSRRRASPQALGSLLLLVEPLCAPESGAVRPDDLRRRHAAMACHSKCITKCPCKFL